MSAIWMLPSLAMGIYMGFASGMWQLAFMSMGSALIALIVSKAATRTRHAPIISLHPRARRLLADGKVVGWIRWLVSKRIRKAVRAEINNLIGRREALESIRRILGTMNIPPPGSKTAALCGVSRLASFNIEITEAPHIFVVGPTGCGKSQLLLLMLRSLSARYSPAELGIAIIDYKGGALIRSLACDARLWLSATDLQPGDWWVELEQQLRLREQRLEASGIADYRSDQLAPLVTFIDELGEAVRNPAAARVVSAVAARGRSLGMFLVASNQGLSGVPRELLLNLRMRIAIAGIDQVELVQLGAKASPLISKSSDLVAARAIKQGQAEIDFDFPLPVADEFGYSSADSIETESSPWAAPTASLVSKPS